MGKSTDGMAGFWKRLFGDKKDTDQQTISEEGKNDSVTETISDVGADPERVKHILELFKQNTNRDVVTITLEDCDVALTGSKFGGTPYIPRHEEAPKNTKGQQLRLLAQIRMDELPESEIGYPKQGMLQFWALDDDTTGLDFQYSLVADDYRVMYHSSIDETVTKEKVEEKYHPFFEVESYFPIQDELGLRFTLEEEAMTYSDYQFEKTLVALWNKEYPDDLITDLARLDEESIAEAFSAGGHKIGGYPLFTQWDPRENKRENHQILLLQIDSFGVGNKQIMWGDSGVANFFITRDDLEKLDFSSVLYNWDCY